MTLCLLVFGLGRGLDHGLGRGVVFLIRRVISAVHLWDSKILAALAFAVFIRVAAPPVGTEMGQTVLVKCNIAHERPCLNQI